MSLIGRLSEADPSVMPSFSERDLVGLVTNKDIIICRVLGLEDEEEVEIGLWSVKVDGFNPNHTYRRVDFNQGRGELHCISGTEGGLVIFKRTIVSCLVIDLRPLLNDLARFDDRGFKVNEQASIVLTDDSSERLWKEERGGEGMGAGRCGMGSKGTELSL